MYPKLKITARRLYIKEVVKMQSLHLNKIINQPYKYGFSSNIDSENFPKGLNEEIVHLISKKKKSLHTYVTFA